MCPETPCLAECGKFFSPFFFFFKEILKIAAFPLETHFSRQKKKKVMCGHPKKYHTGVLMTLKFVFKSLFIEMPYSLWFGAVYSLNIWPCDTRVGM